MLSLFSENQTYSAKLSIRVTTIELYENLFDSMKDVLWDNPNYPNYNDFIKIAKGISAGDVFVIRTAFADGYAPMMMGKKIDELNKMDTKEIRVYQNINFNEEKLICVLVDQEISY